MRVTTFLGALDSFQTVHPVHPVHPGCCPPWMLSTLSVHPQSPTPQSPSPQSPTQSPIVTHSVTHSPSVTSQSPPVTPGHLSVTQLLSHPWSPPVSAIVAKSSHRGFTGSPAEATVKGHGYINFQTPSRSARFIAGVRHSHTILSGLVCPCPTCGPSSTGTRRYGLDNRIQQPQPPANPGEPR